MITGFNTDIKHGKKTFHVQTEDRGRSNPIVESLVYHRGEILLAKRSPYEELIQDGRIDESAVRELMDNQHRLVIEAIRRGRFDGVTPGDAPPALEGEEALTPLSAAAAAATAAILSVETRGHKPRLRPGSVLPVPRRPAAPSSLPISPSRKPTDPASAPRDPESASPDVARSLDQVIIDYLASEAATDRLQVSFVPPSSEPVSGETCTVAVKASMSLTGQPVAGADVTIRVVFSMSGPPHVLHRGVTGPDGLLKATVTIPQIGSAAAAMIVAGTSPIGNHEIKQLVKRK